MWIPGICRYYKVAPEIFTENGYDLKVDIFSSGVILYLLLTGYSPFHGKTFKEVMAKNMECNPNFNSNIWNSISKEGLDLVQKMMNKNPEERISAEVALKHPWFKLEFDEITELNDALENMLKYKNVVKISLSKMKDDEKICTRTPLMIGNACGEDESSMFTPRSLCKLNRGQSRKSSLLVRTLRKEFQISVMHTFKGKTPSPARGDNLFYSTNDTSNGFQASYLKYIKNDESKNFKANNSEGSLYIPDESEISPRIPVFNMLNEDGIKIQKITSVKISNMTKLQLNKKQFRKKSFDSPYENKNSKITNKCPVIIKMTEDICPFLNPINEIKKISQNPSLTSQFPTLEKKVLMKPNYHFNFNYKEESGSNN